MDRVQEGWIKAQHESHQSGSAARWQERSDHLEREGTQHIFASAFPIVAVTRVLDDPPILLLYANNGIVFFLTVKDFSEIGMTRFFLPTLLLINFLKNNNNLSYIFFAFSTGQIILIKKNEKTLIKAERRCWRVIDGDRQ
jgi:hypothetical protein